MNLWNISKSQWDATSISTASFDGNSTALYAKLGDVVKDGGQNLGPISSYYVKKYGFSPDCVIAPSTGDNPATILALPLQPQDAIVSLGTSSTLLMSTPTYYPSPAYHMFDHPTTPGLYMFMLCYKNGGLAREAVRDSINSASKEAQVTSWEHFNKAATSASPINKKNLGFYFPLPEIVPNVTNPGFYRFSGQDLSEDTTSWDLPTDDARAILESQALSMRLRSKPLLPANNPQPRRIYLVGGGSSNPAIASVIADVMGGVEGVFKLDVGNACALGAAYKAVWAVERSEKETFEHLVGKRWKEEGKVEKLVDGYKKGVWEKYGEMLPLFAEAEGKVVRGEAKVVKSLGSK